MNIRKVRKSLGLSQEALARRADVSLNVVSRLERGEITDPHISTLLRIAHALGVELPELLEGVTENNNDSSCSAKPRGV